MGLTADRAIQPLVRTDTLRAQSGERDAGRLSADDLPARPLPTDVSGRKPAFQAVFRRSVLDDIRAHGQRTIEVEVCGVLVGNVYRDPAGPYCLVEANIRGNHASGRNAQVTFTSETWAHINQAMDRQHADKKIVGWYHTHPGFGIFLSEMDLFIQQNFFSEPWQIAYVDDPVGGDRGAFIWREGAAVREEFLVEDDTKTAKAAVAAPVELAARIRELDRQVRQLRGRLRWTRFIAVTWPLLLLAFLFIAGVLPISGWLKFVPTGMWPAHAPATQPSNGR